MSVAYMNLQVAGRCQTKQICENHPLPNIGAYKIPQLQSQFPPNPTPNWKDPHPATYKSIHTTDIPPNLTNARKW